MCSLTPVLSVLGLLLILACPRGAAAAPSADENGVREPESLSIRSWGEEQRHGLQAGRLSVTVATLNVVYLSLAATVFLGSPSDNTDGVRRAMLAIGTTQVAGAVANLVWLVYAGESLRDYKQRSGKWTSIRKARLHTAFTGIDTSFRLAGVAGGTVALIRGRQTSYNFNRGTGLLFLIPNLAVLPFHIWALVANSRELRHRKRAVDWSRARRLEPLPSGFRF